MAGDTFARTGVTIIGKLLFDRVDVDRILLEVADTIHSPRVTHLKHRVKQ